MVKRKESVVPIIQQDLGQEETILQIAFALDSLEKVATNIFCHVECEIEKSKQRLTDVQGRCQKVNSKVLKLTGISKSITVFCSSKYPAPSRDRFYAYDFKHIEISRPHIKVKYKPLPPEKMSMKEKLKFYHIKDKSQMLRKNIEISPLDGLGGLPSDIKCISSLLLFNTNENLFKNYKIVDPLSYKHKPTSVEVRLNKKSEIEPAPISIGLNEDSGYRFERNYFYSPSLQDVPQIEAPPNLPHLTGIAGDLRYTVDHPTIEGVTEEDRVLISVDSEPEPAIIEALPKLETSDTETRVAPPPPEMPPPPPPPPPPQPPQPPPPPSLAPAEPTTNQRPPSVDLRANLMEAIRNAGGSAKAKLKSVSDLNSIDTSSERKPTGNNLMDDLHAKLSMRRKGISGKMENPEGLMERMVSMIPPPPSKPVENEVDEDWDD